MSPSTLRGLTSMAADAVSSQVKGQCPTTNIWLHLGQLNDPRIKTVLDQVRVWMDLCTIGDRVTIARAWSAARWKFDQADNPWNTVKGPIGATIGTLYAVGWKPLSPDRWIDSNNVTWDYVPGSDYTNLINEIRDQTSLKIWDRAAEHMDGAGLEKGADLSVLKQHIQWYTNKGMHTEAGLLGTIAAGGLWPQKRRFETEPPMVESPTCPHCGKAPQDSYHLFWGCEISACCAEEAVIKTNFLKHRARRCKPLQACLWMRGITPKEWTVQAPVEDMQTHLIRGRDPWAYFYLAGNTYLDGSGGKYSKDPRIRKCGYAWIQQASDPKDEYDALGMFATLTGRQTVPRSELSALIMFLSFLLQLEDEQGIQIIHTDNDMVFKGVKKRKKERGCTR